MATVTQLFYDGFETGDDSLWTADDALAISSLGAMGRYHAQFNNESVDRYARKDFGQDYTTLCSEVSYGMAGNPTVTHAVYSMFLDSDGDVIFALGTRGAGDDGYSYTLDGGSTWTDLDILTYGKAQGYRPLRFKVLLTTGISTGALKIWQNRNLIVDLSSIDTTQSGSVGAPRSFQLGNGGKLPSDGTAKAYIEDVYVWDGDPDSASADSQVSQLAFAEFETGDSSEWYDTNGEAVAASYACTGTYGAYLNATTDWMRMAFDNAQDSLYVKTYCNLLDTCSEGDYCPIIFLKDASFNHTLIVAGKRSGSVFTVAYTLDAGSTWTDTTSTFRANAYQRVTLDVDHGVTGSLRITVGDSIAADLTSVDTTNGSTFGAPTQASAGGADTYATAYHAYYDHFSCWTGEPGSSATSVVGEEPDPVAAGTSYREVIIQDIETAINAITQLKETQRANLPATTIREYPTAILLTGDERKREDAQYGMVCDLDFEVQVVARAYEDLETEASSLIADVETALYVDRKRGGYAYNTIVNRNEIVAPDMSNPTYAVSVYCTVSYLHDVGAPDTYTG